MKSILSNLFRIVSVLALCECVILGWPHWTAFAAEKRLAPDGVNTITDLGGGLSTTTLAHAVNPNISPAWTITVPDEILLVTGLRREETIRFPQDPTSLTFAKFFRPERPEEIVVTITTADGRKWRAKWEEVKN